MLAAVTSGRDAINYFQFLIYILHNFYTLLFKWQLFKITSSFQVNARNSN